MKLLRILFLILFGTLPLSAEVVAPSPDFLWIDSSGRPQSSLQFRGRPVVLLIAPSPRDRQFRSQLRALWPIYERLGANKAVFIAAFTRELGQVSSNIPFVLASDGTQVGSLYNSPGRFSIAIIGRDGNLDSFSHRVLSGQRVLDIINNSFVAQSHVRRD